MALFSDVKGFFRFDTDRKRDLRDKFNLLGAVETHVMWKDSLGNYVQGSMSGPVEAILAGRCETCELDLWLNSAECELLRGMPEFAQLHESHQKFHQSGALIVEKLQAGDRNEALLIFKSEYNQALRRLIQALTNINKHLQED